MIRSLSEAEKDIQMLADAMYEHDISSVLTKLKHHDGNSDTNLRISTTGNIGREETEETIRGFSDAMRELKKSLHHLLYKVVDEKRDSDKDRNNKIKTLEREKQDLQQQLRNIRSKHDNDYDQNQQELEDRDKRISKMKDDVLGLQQTVLELKEQMSKAEAIRFQQEQNVHEEQEKRIHAEKLLTEMQDEMNTLELQLNETKLELRKEQERAYELMSIDEQRTLQSEVDKLRALNNKTQQELANIVTRSKQDLENERDNSRRKIDNLRLDFQKQREEKMRYELQVKELKERISREHEKNVKTQEAGEEQLIELKSEITSLRTEMEAERQSLRSQLWSSEKSCQEKIQGLRDVITQDEKMIKLQRQKIEVLEQQQNDLIEEQKEEIMRLQQESSRAMNNIRDMISKYGGTITMDKTDTVHSLIQKLSDSLSKKLEESRMMSSNLDKLIREKLTLEAHVQSLNGRVREKENMINSLKHDLENAIIKMEKQLKNDVKTRDEERQALKKTISVLQEKLNQKVHTENQTSVTIQNLERKLHQCELECKQLSERMNGSLRRHEEEQDTRKREVAELRQSLLIEQRSNDILKQELHELRQTRDIEKMEKARVLSDMRDNSIPRRASLPPRPDRLGKIQYGSLEEQGQLAQSSSHRISIPGTGETISTNIQEHEHQQFRQENQRYQDITESSIQTLLEERNALAKTIETLTRTSSSNSSDIEQLSVKFEQELEKNAEQRKKVEQELLKSNKQYDRLQRKYRSVKDKYFRQSLRHNELQGYLLRMKRMKDMETVSDGETDGVSEQHSSIFVGEGTKAIRRESWAGQEQPGYWHHSPPEFKQSVDVSPEKHPQRETEDTASLTTASDASLPPEIAHTIRDARSVLAQNNNSTQQWQQMENEIEHRRFSSVSGSVGDRIGSWRLDEQIHGTAFIKPITKESLKITHRGSKTQLPLESSRPPSRPKSSKSSRSRSTSKSRSNVLKTRSFIRSTPSSSSTSASSRR